MIEARLLQVEALGGNMDLRGRNVQSIARRLFGRRAQVRQEHNPLTDPTIVRWIVTIWSRKAGSHEVVGVLITYAARG